MGPAGFVASGAPWHRRIRTSKWPGYVYVILLTAKSQKDDVVEGMEAGADDFLSKPFDHDELRVRLWEGERIMRLHETWQTSTEPSATRGTTWKGPGW